MTMPTPAATDLFGRLQPKPADALLSLIKAFRDDRRPNKIDLGVGVYRDAQGRTPVLAAVKEAEIRLIAQQSTKTYLGPEGDLEFLDYLAPVVLGSSARVMDWFGVQTPGGTGALRVASDLANKANPGARIWVGLPTWPNHIDIFMSAGLTVATYQHFDPASRELSFDGLLKAFERAEPGDLFLLHACCHNPTGADLTAPQWEAVACRLAEKNLIPLIDCAYQGLGNGLDEDVTGMHSVIEKCENALVAYSCDKNFGLYRERTGALFVLSNRHRDVARSNVLALTRASWSMPPDHGAAVVRLILGNARLRAQWELELEIMRNRLNGIRRLLAETDASLAALADQRGLFALLPLSAAQIKLLRDDWSIYAVGSGRINIAGLTDQTARYFVDAVCAVTGP